jgi:hypothetical protein
VTHIISYQGWISKRYVLTHSHTIRRNGAPIWDVQQDRHPVDAQRVLRQCAHGEAWTCSTDVFWGHKYGWWMYNGYMNNGYMNNGYIMDVKWWTKHNMDVSWWYSVDIYIYVHTYTSTDVSDGDIKLRCTWILPEIAKIKTYVVGVYPLLQSATFRF